MWVMDRLLADHAELKKKYDTLLEDYQRLVHKYEELSWMGELIQMSNGEVIWKNGDRK